MPGGVAALGTAPTREAAPSEGGLSSTPAAKIDLPDGVAPGVGSSLATVAALANGRAASRGTTSGAEQTAKKVQPKRALRKARARPVASSAAADDSKIDEARTDPKPGDEAGSAKLPGDDLADPLLTDPAVVNPL